MITQLKNTAVLLLAFLFQQCYSQSDNSKKTNMDKNQQNQDSSVVNKTNEEWRKILPADVYYVAREKGTERPFTSKYELSKDVGTYYCAVCGNPLFLSDTKFESGCGWPSFFQPVNKGSILYAADHSYGMDRTEVM